MTTQAKERELLQSAKVIAVVGFSDDPNRTSHQIGKFLMRVGYTVYPVNPTVKEIDGVKVYPTLADVPEPIDIVNVFRRSEYLSGVVDEAIAVNARAVWAQLGVYDPAAADKAAQAGLDMIMDTCIKVSYNTLIIGL
jgi:predicted CoA-binding protein